PIDRRPRGQTPSRRRHRRHCRPYSECRSRPSPPVRCRRRRRPAERRKSPGRRTERTREKESTGGFFDGKTCRKFSYLFKALTVDLQEFYLSSRAEIFLCRP